MHQHRRFANEIGMEILDLKVIDLDRAFQNLVLNFLYRYIAPVAENKDISCSQLCRACPSLCRYIKRVLRSTDNLVCARMYMNQFVGLVHKRADNLFQRFLPCFRIHCPHLHPSQHCFNRNRFVCSQYQRALHKALRCIRT